MALFWILWIFNALMAMIPLAFFFIGLSDGSVSAQNMGLWTIMLFGIAAVLGGTYWLKKENYLVAAKVILVITSIPCLLTVFFFAIVLISGESWN